MGNCSSHDSTDIIEGDSTISVTIPMQWTPGKLVEVTIPDGAPNAGATIRFPVPPNSTPGSVIQVPIGGDTRLDTSNRHLQRDGPLTKQQLTARTQMHPTTELKLKTVTIKYACVSQCGYYPNELTKPNQDSFDIRAPFQQNDMAMFSVFDGHGEFGDLCSQFARDKLHLNLGRRVRHGQEFMTAFADSFIETNDQLHNDPHIDDLMSGTTAVSVVINGGVLQIGNCGDSRAIIISSEEKSQDGTDTLVARPLSKDQTPFRRDERERVKKTGARVMTMDQLDGIELIHEDWDDVELGEQLDTIGDPPRVWAPHECYPGTAFTRSIGDAEAEELGVFAEPELHTHSLSPQDRYVVIASDGVFEFITNQEVAQIVGRTKDPQKACQTLVAESYKRWLQNEPRSDDITIIVAEVSGLVEAEAGSASTGNKDVWRGRHSVAFCP